MRNPEIWIALIILGFLLFGAKKMPDAARGLGRSLRIFKAEVKGMDGDDQAQQHPQYPAQQQPQYPPQIPAGAQQPTYQQSAPAPVAAPVDQSAERRDPQ